VVSAVKNHMIGQHSHFHAHSDIVLVVLAIVSLIIVQE